MEPTTVTAFAPASNWRTEVASPDYSGAADGSDRNGPRRGAARSAFTAFGSSLAVREAREVYGAERPAPTTVESHPRPEVVACESLASESRASESLEAESLTSESPDADSLDPDALEADELLELGDEIATLAAHIHAATYRLLTLIAEFDRRGGWKAGGHRTCAHWLAHRTGMALGPARERVRAARALETLPRISESMSRGELSFSKVRALTRAATPANETELLALAHAGTAAQVEQLVRGWRRHDRLDEAELERERHRSRRFSVAPDADGMYIVRGRLDPEVGALLMRAVEAASDALYRTERSVRDGTAETVRSRIARRMVTDATHEEEIKPGQRRADALGLLAERAMAAGFDGDGNLSGTRAERYQVVVHVEPATLAEGGETTGDGRPARTSAGSEPSHPDACAATACAGSASATTDSAGPASAHPDSAAPGSSASPPENHKLAPMLSELEDGTRVPAETSRRLACDAGVVTIERDSDGSILDVGRKTRSVPPALRRALDARDRGCRFPGCGLRFTDAHHIRHWADGGTTRLGNLVLLCRFHHRLVHEEGFRVEYPEFGHPTFYTPKGLPLPDAPRLPDIVHGPKSSNCGKPVDRGEAVDSVEATDPVEALLTENRRRGIEPDYATARSTYKHDRDIPTSILFPAMEAAEGG